MTGERGPLDGLNDQQARAASHLAGPLLIDAAAGSGKTRTLTQRVVCALTPNAVAGWPTAAVDEVLAITFTEKAAGEIGERVRRALRAAGRTDDARRLDAAWFSTIHGLCARLLRRYALQAGIDPSFGVLDPVGSHGLREQAFEEAAMRAMSSSEAGGALFGRYGFETVASAVGALERELHTRGLDAGELVLEACADASGLHSRAVSFFERMQAAWEACPSATATADTQRDACACTLSSLARIGARDLAAATLAEEVWEVLDWHPKPPPRLKGAEEILAEMAPERMRLLQGAAAAATAPHAKALRDLVGDFGRRYEGAKRACGGLDFDDLQLGALRLLQRRPDIAQQLRGQFRLVMVDEFQDTDALQLELVRALAGVDLCTVGDERQSIYGFRGADLGVYREHVRAMEAAGALRVPLAENYRSHPAVLSFVNAAFGSTPLFGDGFMRLKAMRAEAGRAAVPEGERVRAVLVRRKGGGSVVPREAELIAGRFAALRDAGVPVGSMAVLLRSYKHADEFTAALRRHGMTALVVGGSRFFGRPEVQTLRALCGVMANVRDDEALAQLLASPAGDLSDDALWLLRNAPDGVRRQEPLAEPLLSGEAALPVRDVEAAEVLRGVVERARSRIGRMPLSEILLRAVEESAWDLRLMARGDEGRDAYANVLKFTRLADAFEASGGAGPAGFVEYLDAKEESGDHEAPATLADESTPCVRVMSIHASKGLEFAVIALPQLGEGPRGDRGPVRWRANVGRVELALALPSDRCSTEGSKTNATPWFASFDEDAAAAEQEEMKRLFYVGCTRAEEMLLLTGGTNMDDAPTKGSPLDRLLQAHAEREAAGERLPMVLERSDPEEAAEEEVRPEAAEADESRAFPPAAPAEPPAAALPQPERLSYSDIALYRRCSLRFLAEKLLRLRTVQEACPDDPRAFGSAVHAALQLAVEGQCPDPGRLAAVAAAFGVPAAEVGRLAEVVRGFLGSPLAAELLGYASVRAEVPFVVPVGDPPFLLRGTIDAYGRRGTEGLIVDYKTGTAGTETELRERFALQARCYGLVALRDGCERVRVAFVRPEVAGPDGPQAIGFSFEAADAPALEAELAEDHRRMTAGEYEPLGAWDRSFCPDCAAARTICPLRR